MAYVKIKAGDTSGASLAETIASVHAAVGERMAYHANRLLKIHENGREWSASVDGKRVESTSEFNLAKRKISIVFTQTAIDLAVGFMQQVMRDTMQRAGAQASEGGEWINLPLQERRVRMFLIRKGERESREIFGGGEVKDFKPGDAIFLLPAVASQVYLNASKYGATGFMRKTAAAIRRRLRVSKKGSTISVRAERSRAAFYTLLRKGPLPVRPFGESGNASQIKITVPKKGMDSAWVIAIRLRDTEGGIQRG